MHRILRTQRIRRGINIEGVSADVARIQDTCHSVYADTDTSGFAVYVSVRGYNAHPCVSRPSGTTCASNDRGGMVSGIHQVNIFASIRGFARAGWVWLLTRFPVVGEACAALVPCDGDGGTTARKFFSPRCVWDEAAALGKLEVSIDRAPG